MGLLLWNRNVPGQLPGVPLQLSGWHLSLHSRCWALSPVSRNVFLTCLQAASSDAQEGCERGPGPVSVTRTRATLACASAFHF